MKIFKILHVILTCTLLFSCSSKKQLLYLNDSDVLSDWPSSKNIYKESKIQIGDILQVDINSKSLEAALVYNKTRKNNFGGASINTIMELEGSLVNDNFEIEIPVIGLVSAKDLSISELEKKITNILINDSHLSDPSVSIRIVNFKFTVLGEVRSPGTFSNFKDKLNIFQALGYAGDLTIDAKRKNVKVIREINGIKKVYDIKLTEASIFNHPAYYIRNNDVIVISPSYSKVKSAGFIGSPASIASIASILLSITLLIINK